MFVGFSFSLLVWCYLTYEFVYLVAIDRRVLLVFLSFVLFIAYVVYLMLYVGFTGFVVLRC